MLRILIAAVVSIPFFLVSITAGSAFTDGSVLNAAALGHEPASTTQIAPGSIAEFRGSSLGGLVTVNGISAQVVYASPTQVLFVVPENVPPGKAEVVVTNTDGVSAKAEVTITAAAPGVFTVTADGLGEAIVLDSDRLTTAPFDPANGQRRLSIFATGVKHATNLSVTIGGQPTLVEAFAGTNVSGIDEIHVLLPASLSGTGAVSLIVEADGLKSNSVTVLIGGTTAPSPAKIVISQVFGGGGNSGAPFRNDFIEIFNAGSTPASLGGWSVQYASATASTWSTTALTNITLAPGQRYLIQQAGGSNGAALPTPDATGTIAMAAGAGKVALVKTTTVLTGACPKDDPNIVDFVGYGNTANCFRGTGPAPAGSNTNAVTRATNGCTDTRNNASDFAVAPPNPRNTSSPLISCAVVSSVLPCARDLEILSTTHALAQRRNHNFAPTLRL